MNVIVKYLIAMKKITLFVGGALLVAMVAMTSCNRHQEEITPEPEIEGYEATVSLSVPCGTKSVFVEYQTINGSTTTNEVAVSPNVVAPTDGKDVEPFGSVTLHFSANTICKVERVYYWAGDQKKSAQVDALTGLVVESPVVATKAEDEAVPVILSEPASYVTTDEDQTFYHSSGVVMVEDSWPSSERGKNAYDYDFDDVIVDYDFEAKVMPDRILGARDEQIIAVLHLRCVGSNLPAMVGVKLEGLDMSYVERIEEFRTLDSWQNPHGELPKYIQNTLGDATKTRLYTDDPQNPVMVIGSLQSLNDKRAGQGADAEYKYINGSFTNETVFNVCYKWSEPDKSQYDNQLEKDLADGTVKVVNQTKQQTMDLIRQKKYYNCIPGYMSVAGGLFTYTVIFHMKNRTVMTAEQNAEVKQMMIDAVNNTTAQNFFCVTKDNIPVGLKGYNPVLLNSNIENVYNKKLNEGISAGNISSSNPYAGIGEAKQIWAFKCPTLTKHVWNKMYFDMAYPKYANWIKTEGAEDADWYLNDIDGRFLVCWW